VQLKKLFPKGTEIIEDYFHPLLTRKGDLSKMQLDIWVPSLNLGIEYHGEHHFHDITAFGYGGTLSISEHRDIQKRTVARETINFIEIPYWWDGTTASLGATLHLYFPNMFPKCEGTPIPSDIPPEFRVHQQHKPRISHKPVIENNSILFGNDFGLLIDVNLSKQQTH